MYELLIQRFHFGHCRIYKKLSINDNSLQIEGAESSGIEYLNTVNIQVGNEHSLEIAHFYFKEE